LKLGKKEMKILYASPKEELKREVDALDDQRDENIILGMLQIVKYRNVPVYRRMAPWIAAVIAGGLAAAQGIVHYIAP
jgi:hypothetical protein